MTPDMLGAPLRSPLNAFVRSPLDARDSAVAPGVYAGTVDVIRDYRVDQRARHSASGSNCGGNEILSTFAGERCDYFNFDMVAPGDPATLAEVRAWTLVGVTSGATLAVAFNNPTQECLQDPSFPPFAWQYRYHSVAGLDGGANGFFPDLDVYTRHQSGSGSMLFLTFYWNDPAASPDFIDQEAITVIP